MSISSQAYTWSLSGNGVATTLAINQPLQNTTDVYAYLTSNTGVIQPNLINGTDYTIVNLASSNTQLIYSPSTGPLPTGWTLTANLLTSFLNPTSFTDISGYNAAAVTRQFDYVSLGLLSLQREIIYTQTLVAAGGVLSVNGATGVVTITPAGIGALKASNNLSDVSSSSTSLANLGGITAAATTAAINAAVAGAASQLAVFGGANAVAGAATVTASQSVSNPQISVTGSTSGTYNAITTGGATTALSSSVTAGAVGTLGSHPFSIKTNGVDVLKMLVAGGVYYPPIALTPGTTVNWIFGRGNFFTLTPAQNCTIDGSGTTPGQKVTLDILTSGTSSFTITFGTNIKTGTATLATGTVSGKHFFVTYETASDGSAICEINRTAAL